MDADLTTFGKRYLDFFKTFYFGNLPQDISGSISKAYNLLSSEKIKFVDFGRACTDLEKEFKELPYSFNLAAYVIDYVRTEQQERIESECAINKEPITLPKKRTPINDARMAEAVAKLEKNCPGVREIMERVNTIKEQRKHIVVGYYDCMACLNTGFVSFRQEANYDTGKKRLIVDPKGNFSRRCTCSRGERMAKECKQASPEECSMAAKLNSGVCCEI